MDYNNNGGKNRNGENRREYGKRPRIMARRNTAGHYESSDRRENMGSTTHTERDGHHSDTATTTAGRAMEKDARRLTVNAGLPRPETEGLSRGTQDS